MRAVLFAVFAIPSLAWAQDGAFMAFGNGNQSCAAWLADPMSERIGSEWIWGYWSGRNASESRAGAYGNVGSTTDNIGIVGEVRLVCEAAPSKALIMATNEVYMRMQRDRR